MEPCTPIPFAFPVEKEDFTSIFDLVKTRLDKYIKFLFFITRNEDGIPPVGIAPEKFNPCDELEWYLLRFFTMIFVQTQTIIRSDEYTNAERKLLFLLYYNQFTLFLIDVVEGEPQLDFLLRCLQDTIGGELASIFISNFIDVTTIIMEVEPTIFKTYLANNFLDLFYKLSCINKFGLGYKFAPDFLKAFNEMVLVPQPSSREISLLIKLLQIHAADCFDDCLDKLVDSICYLIDFCFGYSDTAKFDIGNITLLCSVIWNYGNSFVVEKVRDLLVECLGKDEGTVAHIIFFSLCPDKYISFIGDEDTSLSNVNTLLEKLNDYFGENFNKCSGSRAPLYCLNFHDLENKNIQTLYQMICRDIGIKEIPFSDEKIGHDIEEEIRKPLIAENSPLITKIIPDRFLILDFHHNLVYKLLHGINYILTNELYSDRENFYSFIDGIIIAFINKYVEDIRDNSLFEFYNYPLLSKILVFYCQMSSKIETGVHATPISILIELVPLTQNIPSKISLVNSFTDIASNYDLSEIIVLDEAFKHIFDSLLSAENDDLTSTMIDLIIVSFKAGVVPNDEIIKALFDLITRSLTENKYDDDVITSSAILIKLLIKGKGSINGINDNLFDIINFLYEREYHNYFVSELIVLTMFISGFDGSKLGINRFSMKFLVMCSLVWVNTVDEDLEDIAHSFIYSLEQILGFSSQN